MCPFYARSSSICDLKRESEKVKTTIIWQTVKFQPQTATSYIAAYHATSECMWARSFLGELGLLNLSLPTTLFCDNEATIKISNYHMVKPRSKHFNTKLHCAREKVQPGNSLMGWITFKKTVEPSSDDAALTAKGSSHTRPAAKGAPGYK